MINSITRWKRRFRTHVVTRVQLVENLRCRNLTSGYDFHGEFDRIYFYHIRKCGGTSVNHMFLGLSGEDAGNVYRRLSAASRTISGGKVFVAHGKRLLQQGHYYYGFSHRPAHQLNLPDRTFTFTCLRDPVKRLVSHYRMILEYKKLGKRGGNLDREATWFGDDFGEFLTNVPKEHRLNQLYMFSENYDVEEAYHNITRCSCWFLLEHFAEGITRLSSGLGIGLQPAHVRKTILGIDINDEDLERAKEMLEPEIRLYEKLKAANRRPERPARVRHRGNACC